MSSRSINDSEFVVKLTDMMRVVTWSQDGTEIDFKNLDMFCEKILPLYFRHSNMNSFIRQLNIYSFYKTSSANNTVSFKNQIFRKGNEQNFFLIQRGRKFKDLENFQDRFQKQCEQLITEVHNKRQLTQKTKQTIISLLEYKYTSHANLRRMKCQVGALMKQLKDSRNKKIQQECKAIKSSLLSSISQLLAESKKIDELILNNFLKQYQETKSIKSITEQISSEKEVNNNEQRLVQLPTIGNNVGKSNSYHQQQQAVVIKQQFTPHNNQNHNHQQQQQQPSPQELKNNNLKSFNSVKYLLQELKPKQRQMFLFQPALYLPFHSQNSFMILPSYIPAPSHLPFDSRMSFFQHHSRSKYVEFDNYQEKNINLDDDDYEDSASMSFVKIFPQDGDSCEHLNQAN